MRPFCAVLIRPFWYAFTIVLLVGSLPLKAQEVITSHGYSFFGDLKYPADFSHLEYVNPNAPKGGEISVWSMGGFDNFNPYARKGVPVALASAPYESLLVGTADDYGVAYGLLAEKLEYPADKSWVIFHLRPEARFSDGSPVTAQDVVFSHNLFLEQGLPSYAEAVKKRIIDAQALDAHRVKFIFADGISRRGLISQAGSVPVFSEAWYQATGARLDESRLEFAIGSAPYVMESYDINQHIIYKRNPNYWGNDLPINVGRHNFDRIRVEYFADTTAAFEAFKAGEYTFRQENSSKTWATAYDFAADPNSGVVLEALPNGNVPAATGIVFNLGREKFQDRHVRQAFALAFNFTWTNSTLQFDLFSQRESFWQNSDHAATGKAQGLEREILENLGDLIDPAILSEDVLMPHTSGMRQLDRRNARRAGDLLDAAGWRIGSDGLRRKNGQVLSAEFLEDTPAFDRILLPYIENLKALGIQATYNRVDPSQHTSRSRARDYDIIFDFYRMPLLPSTGLRQQFGSEQADISVFNPAGFSSPAADAIIDHIVDATTTEQVKAGARALDRLLRYEMFIVPVWYNAHYWIAHYNIFGHPDELPPFALGQLDFWWYDAQKAEALKEQSILD